MDNVEEKSIELPDNKLFSFPSKIVYHHYDNRIFVISVDTANWLILNNEEELAFFELLKKYQLKEALEHFSGSTESAESVLAQIIGRDFENTKVELKSIESSLHLYLTNDCNMRCPHCYMNAGIKNNNELEKSEILLLLQGAAKHGVSHLILSGGEIMLCADLVEYINLASKLGMSVELLTNGTLLTEKFILEIKDKVTRVQVSIDGYDEISNSKIRGKGNFIRALNAVDLLVKHSIAVDIGITPRFHDKLHEEVNNFVSFVKHISEKYKDKVTVAFTSALFDGRDLRLTDSDREYYSECVSEITKKSFGGMNKDLGFIKYHGQHGIDENCAYGNITISSTGDIYFCAQISQMKSFGNIREIGIDKMFEFSNKAKEKSNINNVEPCKDCEVKYICGGDCRIKFFESLKDCTSNEMPYRLCNDKIKSSVYEQMLRTHEYLFV